MTLSTAGKNWLAINAGVNNCFSPTGVSFVDADGVPFTMGTKDVVITFIGARMVGKNDAIIIANTSYNGFKTINGPDLSYADATWVNNSDGHAGATLPLYCYPISTELTVSTNDCSAPCTVHGTVSWTNNGGVISSPINLSIIVNNIPTLLASNVTINPQEIKSYAFTLENLVVGTYTIEASPDTGTTPQVVTVRTPAHVISATLTVDTTDCVAPCTVNGTVSWTNNGGSPSPLINLSISYNGNSIPVASAVIINPGETLPYIFSIPGLTAGTYTVQASPNTGTTPKTITVSAPLTDAYFTSIPSGASIYIDGSTILSGATPATITGLTEGLHTYRLTYVGCYSEPTGSFTTVVGSTVNVPLVTFDTSARFESAPAGASIYIDGGTTPSGTTPGVVTGLTPGEHTYKLTKSGYMDVEGLFTAILCQRAQIPANLSRLQEAGMGLIVVGLVLGTLLMGKKKEKEKKKLTYY